MLADYSLKKMVFAAVLIALVAVRHACAQTQGANAFVYQNVQAPPEARVSDLFSRLTQDEKLSMLTGTHFTTTPIPRLGIPAMVMVDAGQGVRGGMPGTLGPATLFSAAVTMSSTWDPALVGRIGAAIGEEALNKGTGANILLGPAVNIQRSPLGGRNGEYFSEDPYLASQLAVGYIQGMQGTGCGACIKHFACNNEEVDRDTVNVRVDERTLREIYLPAFEAGVKEGHVWSVMAAYNKINGYHATASEYLLTEVLKKGWGWDGLLMSDWGAVHETSGVVNAGTDLEMPGPRLLSHDELAVALRQGIITQATIDDHVKRILRAIIRVGLLDTPRHPDAHRVNSMDHQHLAFAVASQGIVLLKNAGGILPLDRKSVRSIAVIGEAATHLQMGATGSPNVQPFYSIQPLDGIRTQAGRAVTVTYASGSQGGTAVPAAALSLPQGRGQGLRAEYFANPDLAGKPALQRIDRQVGFDWASASPAHGMARTNFSVRWTGQLVAPATGHYVLSLAADDGCRLFLDGKPLISHWTDSAGEAQTAHADLVAGHHYALRIEYFQRAGAAFARFSWQVPGAPSEAWRVVTAAARKADVAIVFVSTAGTEGEGHDRPSMALPGDQDALIQAVVAANKRTIVVLNNGTPVLMDKWLSKVPGLIETWFPGQEGGHALAAILFGDVNPSGKLPTTLGARREDYPDFGHFPGTQGQLDYAEGIYVGYRHFDKKQIAPLFPFGYGLSYTTFRYGPLRLSHSTLAPDGTVTATVGITNTGSRTGSEVVELYLHAPSSTIDRPIRELKGFEKVSLLPGETKDVTLTIAPRALAYCDVAGKQWKADAGDYALEVGASSRDIRQTAPLRLTADFTEPIPFMGQTQTPGDPGDLALGRPAVASSVQAYDNVQAENITDGDTGTRWSSQFSDPQWIAVDLGRLVTISRVRLTWEEAYAAAYAVQVSPDGKTWTDVYSTRSGEGGTETVTFAPILARWVRMYGTKRATVFGYSLFSVEVFAPSPQEGRVK